jgi:hypothetical protein
MSMHSISPKYSVWKLISFPDTLDSFQEIQRELSPKEEVNEEYDDCSKAREKKRRFSRKAISKIGDR